MITNTKGASGDFIAASPVQALNAAKYHGLIRNTNSAKIIVSFTDTIMREKYPDLLEECGKQSGALGAFIALKVDPPSQKVFATILRRNYFFKKVRNPSAIAAKIET
jgi:hypothetical protein